MLALKKRLFKRLRINLRLCLLLVLFLIQSDLYSQIKWIQAIDKYELYPNKITDVGNIKISKSRSGGTPTVIGADGEFTIYFSESKVLFKYDSISYLLKGENIYEINLTNNGIFGQEEIFKKKFIDSLQKKYRKTIYAELNFNEIEFLSSRRTEYELVDGKISLKNQKKQKGKICFINSQTVTLLTEEGEIIDFSYGDFNYLYFEGKKMFTITELYNLFYKDFSIKLKDNQAIWTNSFKSYSLEEIIGKIGMFDKSEAISPTRRVYSWKKTTSNYLINFSYTNSQITTNYATVSENGYSSLRSNSYNNINSRFNSTTDISPLFFNSSTYGSQSSYGSSSTYATAYSSNSINASSLGITTSQGIQNGSVVQKNYEIELTIIVDSSNSIIEVYHKNLFADEVYGTSFRFINF